ncbi:MAG: LapA family protein [Desulfatibacillaceae bacterium]|nr:LapA family protein [Desulfatibacillaceae bacterium]
MTNIRWGVFIIVAACVAVFVYLNWELFTTRYALVYWFGDGNAAPKLPNFIYLVLFFALGFLLKLVMGLPAKVANRRTVKELNERIEDLEKDLAELVRKNIALAEKAGEKAANPDEAADQR